MACDIANGRKEPCKDAIGGLDAIYFINFGAFDPEADVTYNATDTDVIDTIDNVTSIYKYELKGANSLELGNIITSRDNGTTYFEQVLAVQLKKLEIKAHKTVKLLAQGRPHIIARNRVNQFFIVGLLRGADVTAGNISSGTQMGDFNGYSITFTAMENAPANFLNCSTESDLATTVLGGATIVTT